MKGRRPSHHPQLAGLNRIRAGTASSPEKSDFTSIQQRIVQYARKQADAEKPKLVRLERRTREGHPNAFSISTEDYLALVDWAGRALRMDKRGAIPARLPPILTRLHISPEHYRHVQRGGRDRHLAVLGNVERLRAAARELGRQFVKGVTVSRRLYLAPA